MKIEKCPFCGSDGILKELNNKYYIECENSFNHCINNLKTYECESEREAIKLWNNRSEYKEQDYIKEVKRKESMSPDGYLELFLDNEGDIIVSVINKERKRSSIEFCWSGGYSKKYI